MPSNTSVILLFLAASMALVMTGFGIVVPVFARRLGEFGAGVEALGLMTMSFAAAQFALAPFMGAFGDRYGRRPLILLALGGFAATNLGLVLAPSVPWFIAVRVVEGAITAGLLPSAMAMVADLKPEGDRGRWVGYVMAGYSSGFILGPALGGILYDNAGFMAPFVSSAAFGAVAFMFALARIPETKRGHLAASEAPSTLVSSLPRPLYVLGLLLAVDFLIVFSFAFIEPVMVFFLYDDLGYSTTQFGVVIGAYGLSLMAGQAFLGTASDRLGRRLVIAGGLVIYSTFYIGLAFLSDFAMVLLIAFVAGVGEALALPALGAAYLDMTAAPYRGRVAGLKESAAALGGVTGPLLVTLVAGLTPPQGIFLASGVSILVVAVAVVVALPSHPRATHAPP